MAWFVRYAKPDYPDTIVESFPSWEGAVSRYDALSQWKKYLLFVQFYNENNRVDQECFPIEEKYMHNVTYFVGLAIIRYKRKNIWRHRPSIIYLTHEQARRLKKEMGQSSLGEIASDDFLLHGLPVAIGSEFKLM